MCDCRNRGFAAPSAERSEPTELFGAISIWGHFIKRMIANILFGSGLAFSAAIQPGPLQEFLFSKVASVGWRRTLPAALAPVLSDGPIAVLMLLVLGQLSETMQVLLRAAGGCLLLYFAYRSFMQWRGGVVAEISATDKLPRTLFEATLVNLLNPNP